MEDLVARDLQKLLHFLVNHVFGMTYLFRREIRMKLARDRMLAALAQLGLHHGLHIRVALGAMHAQFLRRPLTQKPVAPGVDLEVEFFVMGPLVLETLAPFVELVAHN